jgi:hypothetical protein
MKGIAGNLGPTVPALLGGSDRKIERRVRSRSLGRDFNPGPPEYEGVLTTQPRRSVLSSDLWNLLSCSLWNHFKFYATELF